MLLNWLNSNDNTEVDPKGLVEAALFLADKGVTKKELLDLTGLQESSLEKVIDSLKNDLKSSDRGLRLFRDNRGYHLQVKQQYLGQVRHIAPHQDMSKGVLRTLSVIAYNSPVLQKEVVEIRGNSAYSHIDELISRGFVDSEKEGRTKLLSVTDQFFHYFEVESLEELKNN